MKAMRVIWYHACGLVGELSFATAASSIRLYYCCFPKRRENLKQLFVAGSANLLHQPLLVLLHECLGAFQQGFARREALSPSDPTSWYSRGAEGYTEV
jgi:hypothetical protein